ncbi:MAG: NAD(P)H-quinone oxidoreductase subunit N [Cyanobacteria bacterium J06628_6]
MPLLVIGNKFVKDLEKHGALAVRIPLEGGFEGRYQRRARAAGYENVHMSVRGLGDLSAYIEGIHGVRPPHLGKKNEGQAAVGYRYFIPPVIDYRVGQLSAGGKGIMLWLIEGHILSSQEVAYLAELPQREPKIKVVLEMGGDRAFHWEPLAGYKVV